MLTGPFFQFSDTWQLVINTGTTIVTFLMVFLIQRAQNKDSLAIQLKLNELVAAMQGASNRLIDVEDLSEDELTTLHRYYGRLAELAKHEADLLKSHSVEEAEEHHKYHKDQHKHGKGLPSHRFAAEWGRWIRPLGGACTDVSAIFSAHPAFRLALPGACRRAGGHACPAHSLKKRIRFTNGLSLFGAFVTPRASRSTGRTRARRAGCGPRTSPAPSPSPRFVCSPHARCWRRGSSVSSSLT